MPKTKGKVHILLLLPLLVLTLAGCQRDIRVGEELYSRDSTALSLVLEAGELPLLEDFPALESVDLSGSTCYEEILAWAAAHPQVQVRYSVTLPDGSAVDGAAESLDLSALNDEQALSVLPLLDYLPALKSLELGSAVKNDLAPETVLAFLQARPELAMDYRFLCQGALTSIHESSLDLSESRDLGSLLPWAPCMDELRRIELGSGDAELDNVPWDALAALMRSAPQVQVDYEFSLYGQPLTLQSEEINLSHIKIDDEGELVQAVTACMPKLRYLDMDFCGVSDERMAQIRDSLPQAEVVWRIWFGKAYTARTNVDRILASNPGRGGELTAENTQSLKYCTKVKYIDVGHNTQLDDISFVAYMPELEAAVLAMNCWRDARPLLNCPKLDYLEIQTGACADLRPIGQLKNLRHLNICYCFALQDISPIYDLELERLWIGYLTPVPEAQVKEFQRRHPQCKINTETEDPTAEGWRYLGFNEYGIQQLDPRYELLRQQFKYTQLQEFYNYISNDPLYWGRSPWSFD